ncbi:MAG: DNA adenine methylase [Ignavibacteria bacterium]|nr:DNA adenine methylase [Ignavibacteria bacterium]
MVKPSKKIIYSPLRYPGGKGCIFPFVSKLFYENQLIGTTYAEPYAGGAGLALRLLFEGYVENIYINDIDRAIYSFWQAILDEPEKFCDWISEVKVDIKNWKYYKNIQTHLNTVNNFELAQSTFFLNRTNISGVIKGGAIGGLKQKGKYKITARFNKEDLINRILKIAQVKDKIKVTNLDGINFVKRLDNSKKEIFIYLDPPYFCKGACLYMNYYKQKDHLKLSKHVSSLKKKWMVSYDNHDFILNLYAENKKVSYKLSQCASNRIGDELLIFSNKLSFINSIKMLSSSIIL